MKIFHTHAHTPPPQKKIRKNPQDFEPHKLFLFMALPIKDKTDKMDLIQH